MSKDNSRKYFIFINENNFDTAFQLQREPHSANVPKRCQLTAHSPPQLFFLSDKFNVEVWSDTQLYTPQHHCHIAVG